MSDKTVETVEKLHNLVCNYTWTVLDDSLILSDSKPPTSIFISETNLVIPIKDLLDDIDTLWNMKEWYVSKPELECILEDMSGRHSIDLDYPASWNTWSENVKEELQEYLRCELYEVESRVSDLTDELDNYISKYEDLEERNSELESKIYELDEKIDELEQYDEVIAEKDSEIEQLNETISALNERIKELESRG